MAENTDDFPAITRLDNGRHELTLFLDDTMKKSREYQKCEAFIIGIFICSTDDLFCQDLDSSFQNLNFVGQIFHLRWLVIYRVDNCRKTGNEKNVK